MATKEQLEASELYRAIIVEIRLRIVAIDQATSGFIPVNAKFVEEFCYLQIRMICELIAIACLVAHGDIKGPSTRKLERTWNADIILKALGSLHGDFFPVAVKRTKTLDGWHLEPIVPSPLTKVDVQEIYGKCGDKLHRGNRRNIMSPNQPEQKNFRDINGIAQRFRDLISSHTIFMITGDVAFVCAIIRINDNQENISVAVMEGAG